MRVREMGGGSPAAGGSSERYGKRVDFTAQGYARLLGCKRHCVQWGLLPGKSAGLAKV